MYGLHTAWLNKAGRKRLDAFHCRCLRRIYGIAPSYYSRISDEFVIQTAGAHPLHKLLLEHQLRLYAHVARMDDQNPTRTAMLQPGTVKPQVFIGSRRRGRPRRQWNNQVYTKALRIAGSTSELGNLLADNRLARVAWERAVTSHRRSHH